MPLDPESGVYFETFGDGPNLFLGPVFFATQRRILGPEAAPAVETLVDVLSRRFTVLVADYPGIGESRDIDPATLTADAVCADLLSVAAHAGFDRFAFWGYSWGGSVGLQLALRTDRLTGLIVGGWSPMGAPYETILKGAWISLPNPPASSMAILRNKAQYRQWVTYYESLEGYSESVALARVKCPRLVYVGEHADSDAGDLHLPIASAVKANTAELKRAGWDVAIVPGLDHGGVLMNPAAVLKAVTPFINRLSTEIGGNGD